MRATYSRDPLGYFRKPLRLSEDSLGTPLPRNPVTKAVPHKAPQIPDWVKGTLPPPIVFDLSGGDCAEPEEKEIIRSLVSRLHPKRVATLLEKLLEASWDLHGTLRTLSVPPPPLAL